MTDKIINLNLDLNAPPAILHVTQGDTAWRWHFRLFLSGLRWTIPTGAQIILKGLKPDGHVFAFSGEISSNEAVVTSDLQMTICAGEVPCSLIILDANAKRLAFGRITMYVAADAEGQFDVASESALPAYVELLEQYAQIINEAASIPDDLPGYIQTNVNAWLAAHPEATTTVQDGAVTKAKLHADLKNEIEGSTAAVGDLKSATEQENLAAGLTWTLGKRISASGEINDNDSFAISNAIPVKKAWIKRNTPTKDSSDNAFYMHIHKYKNGTWKSYSSLSYGNSIEITETDDIDSIMIGFGYSLSSGIILTQQTIDNYFDVDLFSSVYSTQAVDNFLKSINDTRMMATKVNLTSSTIDAECNSDADNLPNNRIYGYNVSPDVLAHAPENASTNKGIFITFGKTTTRSATDTQLFIDKSGEIFSRVYFGESEGWQNWYKYESNIKEYLANNYLTRINANETYATSKSNLLSNISEPVIFNALGTRWNDSPISGWFINLPYTGNYSLQVIGRSDDSKMFQRIVNRNDGSVYTNWGIIYVAQPMKILALGDSICYGYRNDYKGFVGDLGYDYKNIGVSGATISNVRTDRTNIVDQLSAETEYQPDIIIAEGGINDWTFGAKLGTVPNTPITTDTEANAILAKESGVQTVMEAMSVLFYEMIKKYPTAQRFFLIVHKIKKAASGVYCPTTKNIGRGGDFTQQELHDAQVAICNLYNVKVMDIYNNGMLNSIFSQYVSPNSNFIDDDGVHPLPLGYTECYLPIVREAIMTGTKK